MTDPLLEIEDLHVEFATEDGIAEVINGIDMSIGRGQTTALVGETGCGKTVTAKAILGLLSKPPARIPEGTIRFDGRDLLSLSARERHATRGSEMSMIMQDPMTSLNPVYTIGEQMMDVLKWQDTHGFEPIKWLRDRFESDADHRDRAIQMLEDVQISAPERVFTSYPVELSGGMRQRVLIAIAMLLEPAFLIADEPGTALDVTTQDKILTLLSNLTEEKDTSVLYITHDLGVAKAISDEVNVMYAGEIVEKAPTDQLFDAPHHPYTRGLLDSIPRLATGIGSGIEGEIPDYTNPPRACRFADRCRQAEEACRSVHPYPRTTAWGHTVACHLYSGPATTERDRERHTTGEVTLGEPPWIDEFGTEREGQVDYES